MIKRTYNTFLTSVLKDMKRVASEHITVMKAHGSELEVQTAQQTLDTITPFLDMITSLSKAPTSHDMFRVVPFGEDQQYISLTEHFNSSAMYQSDAAMWRRRWMDKTSQCNHLADERANICRQLEQLGFRLTPCGEIVPDPRDQPQT